MTPMTLRAAVVGLGVMGANHARIYFELEGVELAAVCDADKALAEKTAKKYRCMEYTDANDMLKKEKLDMVSIVVPTKYHKEVAVPFIEAGINVLVEKPIAATADDAKAIIAAAKKNNVKLMIGHVERFNPAIVELKKMMGQQALGRIYKIAVERRSTFPQRVSDVGVAIDLSVHDIDIIRYITGADFISLSSFTERKLHSKHEDALVAIFKLNNGAIGTLNIDWLTPTIKREISFAGEKGMFMVEYLGRKLTFYQTKRITEKDLDYTKPIDTISLGDMTQIAIKEKEPLRAELEAFAACVRDDTESPVSGEDGLKALELAYQLLGK